jgi:acyl dehydratase
MNYGAAVGDNNPIYFNDERAGGIIAPPMFAVALTWPICERIWEFIQVDDFPKELLGTLVHYTEHLTFHRTVRPGDHLTVKGCIAAILPHKAGTLMVLRLAAVDESSIWALLPQSIRSILPKLVQSQAPSNKGPKGR